MKKLFFMAAVALMAVSCNNNQTAYTVEIENIPAELQGETIYLANYDNGARLDSAFVGEGPVTFTGEIESPIPAMLATSRGAMGTFVLEKGNLIVNMEEGTVTGTPQNSIMNENNKIAREMIDRYYSAEDEDARNAVEKQLEDFSKKVLQENPNNVVGYFELVSQIPSMSYPEVEEALKDYPTMANYERIQKGKDVAQLRYETSPGQKFKDFQVSYNGKTERFSDYVGKGKYTLVDFWASWCRPCIRQVAVLKEIKEKYKKNPNLEFLGIAVWDKPEDTEKAIVDHGIEWPCIINAQTIPTDIYGIAGIPCIMLIGPDGTILSRDLQGDELKAAVDEHLEK